MRPETRAHAYPSDGVGTATLRAALFVVAHLAGLQAPATCTRLGRLTGLDRERRGVSLHVVALHRAWESRACVDAGDLSRDGHPSRPGGRLRDAVEAALLPVRLVDPVVLLGTE